jgi:hypothetical protein
MLALLMAAAATSSASAAWHEAKSEHFIILADLEPAELRAYGERLERFDQAVRTLRSMDDPPLTDGQRLTIFALKNEEAVGKLAGSSDILGFYLSGAAGSYAFVPRGAGFYTQRAEMSAESVFFHEYAHHLQLGDSQAALPAWVTEGFAEFFGTAEILEDGGVRVGRPPISRQWSVQRNDGFPIIEMLAGTLRGMSWRDVESLYGRGWLLTHMLSFDPAGRQQLKSYIDFIQQGVEPLQAAKKAFGDDLRALDHRMDSYLRQRSFKTLIVAGEKLTPAPISVRPLRPGEAAVVDEAMLLRRGVDRKEAIRLAARLKAAAAANPGDPAARLIYGQSEFAAHNYAAAEAAGRQAFTADPKLSAAAILVGKARSEAAKKSPAGADWKEIRSWFLQANRIDPESAEPLWLYYRTFVFAGAAPTKNATDGLLYAVQLAPRDELLRIDAVRQLVVENRLAEATRLFAPAAFYPHSGQEWRERKANIVDALKKADRDTALGLLDAELKERRDDEED